MNFLSPLPEGYRVVATSWAVVVTFTCAFVYLVAEQFGSRLISLEECAAVTLVPPAAFLLLSFISIAGERRLIWMSVFVGIGFIPMLLLLLALDFLFLLSLPMGVRLPLGLTMVASILLWCCWRVIGFRRIVVERRFIVREFSIEDRNIVVSEPRRTSLEPKRPKSESAMTKLFNRLGPHVAVIAPIAYPLQRALSSSSGDGAVLLLLAALAFPLTLHVTGRMACGGYLWVYWPLKLSLRHRKAVIVQSA